MRGDVVSERHLGHVAHVLREVQRLHLDSCTFTVYVVYYVYLHEVLAAVAVRGGDHGHQPEEHGRPRRQVGGQHVVHVDAALLVVHSLQITLQLIVDVESMDCLSPCSLSLSFKNCVIAQITMVIRSLFQLAFYFDYLSGEGQVDEEGNDEGAEGDGRLVLPQPRVLVHEARGDRLEGARHGREARQYHQTEQKFAMTKSKVIPGKI